jgi:hypothetical protein
MPRGWLLLLCIVLLVWRPLDFALELPSVLPSLGMRGPIAIVEVLFHGVVAALAVAAVQALWSRMPAGPILAAAAVIASAAASVQALYWSLLPHQTAPGDELPLAMLSVAHAAVWLVYLKRSRRVRELAGQRA